MIWDPTALTFGLVGGVLIGLASAALMLFNGRIAGVSGIFRGALNSSQRDTTWRVMFVLGLLVVGTVASLVAPQAFDNTVNASIGLTIGAGLLVGFGTSMGSGCTSGHGICGISRFSARSLFATVTFIATGAATVFVIRSLGVV